MNTKLATKYTEILQRIERGEFYSDYDRDVESLGTLRQVRDELYNKPNAGLWGARQEASEKLSSVADVRIPGEQVVFMDKRLYDDFLQAYLGWIQTLRPTKFREDGTPVLGSKEQERLYKFGALLLGFE